MQMIQYKNNAPAFPYLQPYRPAIRRWAHRRFEILLDRDIYGYGDMDLTLQTIKFDYVS
jgi:hypothetical protein